MSYDFDQMSADELGAVETQMRDEIDRADADQDTVRGHDLRCLLDQCVAAQENADAAAEDDAG